MSPNPRNPRNPRLDSGPWAPWVGHLLRCVVLLLLVGIVYRNSFQSGWVLDNRSIIQLDPRNKAATLENFKLIWTKDYWWPRSDSGGYRPMVSTSYLLNWSVFGNGNHARESDQVVGFHWVNLIAHGINAILVYFLLLKLLRRHWAAFFAAALFAVHPIATESVTNIIGRADEFVAMSFIGCTLLYIRSTEVHGLRRLPWLLGLMALFQLGLFSKESSLAFLAVPILFDGVYRWGSEQYDGRRARTILIDWFFYALITLPFIVLLSIRSAVFRDAPAPAVVFLDNPILRFSWNDASTLAVNVHNWILGRLTACNVAAKAFWKLVWPADLSSDYSFDQIKLFGWQLSNAENIKSILALLFIAGTLALAAWCYKRHKAVCFFILLYWFAYGPTSNFLVNSPSILAERFLYIPSIAFCALMVLGAEGVARRIGATLELDRSSIQQPWPRLVPHAVILAILVLYGFRTYNRNFDWRSDVALAQSAIKASPNAFRSYQTLAFAYYERDPTSRIDRIIELGETGVRILDPLSNTENNSRTYLDLGIYYGVKGETSAGRTADGSVLVTETTRQWYRKSARVLERASEIDLAANEASRIRQIKRGRTEIPDVGLPGVYMYLGIAYSGLGMDEKALEAFHYMRHLEPLEAEAYARIASTQLALGRFEDAAVSLLQCVILAPQRTAEWQSLTQIYAQTNHEPIPAVDMTEGRLRLREDNKMVQQHLLRAYTEFLKIARSSERPAMLSQMRDLAVNSHQLSPSLLDGATSEKVTRPVPPSPAFHTYGKKLFED